MTAPTAAAAAQQAKAGFQRMFSTLRPANPTPRQRKQIRRGHGTSLARRFPKAAPHWSQR